MSEEITICTDFQEHKDWRVKHPTGPATWDAWCSLCGFKLEDRPWASGLAIEGGGRRLAEVVKVLNFLGSEFVSRDGQIVCSKCCPQIVQ